MLQKTEQSQASTNAQAKTASFFTAKAREMFREGKKGERGGENAPNDLILLQPKTISSLAWPQLFLFDNDLTASIRDNFYQIGGLRGGSRFLPRRSHPNGELVFFHAERPRKRINLFSVERLKEGDQLWLHLNLTKDDQELAPESIDLYLPCQHSQKDHTEIWDFRAFQSIQNSRKGVLVVRALSKGGEDHGAHRVLLVDLMEKRRGDNRSPLRILSSAEMFCEDELGEKLLKTIKSEFGDIILIVTNKEIYEVEVEEVGQGHKLTLKPYRLSKILAGTRDNYLRSEGVIRDGGREMGAKSELVLDAQFVSNGLKIMLLTNCEQIIFIEAHNFLFAQGIHDVLATSPLSDKYKLDAFRFTHIHSINGSLALQFHSTKDTNLLYESSGEGQQQRVTQGFLLLKPQNNYLAYGKLIALPFHAKDVIERRVHDSHTNDEILVQYIQRAQPHTLRVLKCRILMAELNSIVRLPSLEYCPPRAVDISPPLLTHFAPTESERRYVQSELPSACRVYFLLSQRQLTCYKIFSQIDAQRISKSMRRLFSLSFFQKAVKMAISPLTLHFVIVFKEFVKFYHFHYSTAKNYFTLKLKHVVDAQYVNNGSQILLTTQDGALTLIDAYRFTQQKILDFYGEPIETYIPDQRHLLVRSNKSMLVLFRRPNQEKDGKEYQKHYEVRFQEGDHFVTTPSSLLIFRKNAQMQLYSHTPIEPKAEWGEAQRECLQALQNSHINLANRISCGSFEEDEGPTQLLLSQELGFLFVGTNRGNVKQYLWPLQNPVNPNPPAVFTQQVSARSVIGLSLDANYSCLYASAQNGTIVQLNVKQYINGQAMPYTYIFSEKTREAEQQKREFTDRTYFIDNYTPTQGALTQAAVQNQEQLEFFVDKLKDDLEEMTRGLLTTGKQRQTEIKQATRHEQERFRQTLEQDQSICSSSLAYLRSQLQQAEKTHQADRARQEQSYQKKLLQLYRESDRLKRILTTQDDRLTQQKLTFLRDFQSSLSAFEAQRENQVARLEAEYKAVQERRRIAERQKVILQRQEEAEMEVFKIKVHEQQEGELKGEEEQKQRLLGQNTKKQKSINNLKHRSNYFENLILETTVQINQLKKDQLEYERKKAYLRQELTDKEDIIQKIQKQLVLYLKNTEDMKTIKNNHQFELNQYEKEVNPIHDDYKRIEDNVKHMNHQIMQEYNHKVHKAELIAKKTAAITALKQQNKQLTLRKLEQLGRFRRLTETLTDLASKTFEIDLKKELKTLLDSSDKEASLLRLDENKEKMKKDGQKLLRYKNMLRKEIQEEEKREQHVVKNQHQFYKYHQQNTTLLRQFNDLKKTHKILADQNHKLAEKLSAIRMSRPHTPLNRVPSLNIRPKADHKLTPFQKYEEQASANRKNQDTTDTKLSRNSQSLSFLKGLMKQVNQTDSKFQKMEVMRQRVRTFVNPQLRTKPEELKKILFGRTRGTSQMLKLK